MDRFAAITVFCKVAETGSFAQAARALAMSPPAVTRHVAWLEATIGARLVARTTRMVKLTEAGRIYFDDCRRILSALSEADAAAAGSFAKPAGSLAVTAPVLFGQMHVLPALSAFLQRNPAVSGRAILLDRPVNPVEEGIDVAVRIGALPDSGLIARRVGAVRRVTCASPGYLRRHGRPARPEDLAGHVIVASVAAASAAEWIFGQQASIRVPLSPWLVCNLNGPAIDAAVAGLGITRVLSYQVARQIADGSLDLILEEFEEPDLPVHILHAEGQRPSAKVRAFVDFLAKALRANPAIRERPRSALTESRR